jgi:uncharacterized coiled-coil DUF342 family protein
VLLLIFTKSRIEGARNRKNVNSIQTADISTLKTSDAAQTGDIATLKTQTGDIVTNNKTQTDDIGKLKTSYENLNKDFSGLAAKVQNASGSNTKVIEDANAKAIGDFKSIVDSKVTEIESKNASILQNLDSKQKEILNDMDLNGKKISDNLYNQSTMYITDMKSAAADFDKVKTSVMTAKDETLAASQQAKNSAESAEQAYKDMLGLKTLNDVRSAGKQAFTTMFSGVNFVPNTGYYETFVQRERFETVPLEPKSGTSSLNTLTEEVISKINNFNAAYSAYVLVPDSAPDATMKALKLTELNTANTELTNALDALNAAYPTTANNPSYKNDTNFKIEHAAIVEKSKQIDAVRQELDAKMENILKGRAPQNDFTNEYDSTVYTGVLWSILGTSLLYYIFTEL